MDSNMHYDPNKDVPRWLGYFDLLGTSALIETGKILDVFYAYRSVLKQLSGWMKRHANVSPAWFSDTFIVFADDDSAESFASIEMVCRWLMFALIRRKVPVRGALACGQFYSDQANNLYFGSALLEAYLFGENQDWIGLVLCPSSIEKLKELDLPVEKRLNYVKYDIPFKNKFNDMSIMSAACILGDWSKIRGEQNPLIGPLNEMMNDQQDEYIRRKYERTIRFIEEKSRSLVIDTNNL